MEGSEPGCVVLVGAGGALGSAIGQGLAEDGFGVLKTYRRLPADPAVDEKGRQLAYRLDVGDRASVTAFFQRVEDDFGPPFGLVYAAGRLREGPITLLADAAWDETIQVNLTGAFTCLRAVARAMMVGGQGRIVLIGSVSGRMGIPGQGAYAASKAGLQALARVAAAEFGRYGICCNVVAPGAIDTGMFDSVGDAAVARIMKRTALRRLGTSAEVAAAVRFLLTPAAAYITGETITMDGGLSIS